MSGRTVVGAGFAAAALLSGCFTTTADYRTEAEAFIVGTETADELGVAMESARCEEPENQDVGTQFGCTATDEDGGSWTFTVTIEEDDRFAVSVTDGP